MSGETTAYDRIPYPAGSYPQSHPDRLATLATLFGMDPPDIRACRVLELGCADGSNLIPMACALPGSAFVGVDLSARQVDGGRAAVDAMGLENIELRHLDIRQVDESFGAFDYVIVHGVYSWVPADVQRKILAICRERLRENGVAYVSYNTNPGWRMRGMLRDMMLRIGRMRPDFRARAVAGLRWARREGGVSQEEGALGADSVWRDTECWCDFIRLTQGCVASRQGARAGRCLGVPADRVRRRRARAATR